MPRWRKVLGGWQRGWRTIGGSTLLPSHRWRWGFPRSVVLSGRGGTMLVFYPAPWRTWPFQKENPFFPNINFPNNFQTHHVSGVYVGRRSFASYWDSVTFQGAFPVETWRAVSPWASARRTALQFDWRLLEPWAEEIQKTYPIGSMYGIFTYIWLIFMVNVTKYTIHGSYGYWNLSPKLRRQKLSSRWWFQICLMCICFI